MRLTCQVLGFVYIESCLVWSEKLKNTKFIAQYNKDVCTRIDCDVLKKNDFGWTFMFCGVEVDKAYIGYLRVGIQ